MGLDGVLGGCQRFVQLFGRTIRIDDVAFGAGRILRVHRLQLGEVGDGLRILFQLLGYVTRMRQECATVLLFGR